MTEYVLDTSALVAFIENEEGSSEIQNEIDQLKLPYKKKVIH